MLNHAFGHAGEMRMAVTCTKHDQVCFGSLCESHDMFSDIAALEDELRPAPFMRNLWYELP